MASTGVVRTSQQQAAGKSQQLVHDAVHKIRELISSQVLLPGEKLRQVDIAERIGVSRSPLREALRTLESEGVVAYENTRGYVVARLDLRELAQLYRLRELIEVELLSAIKDPLDEDIAKLDELASRMGDAIKRGASSEFLDINRQFKFSLYEMSDMAIFIREMRRLWDQSIAYRAPHQWPPAVMAKVADYHYEIVDGLRARDMRRVIQIAKKLQSTANQVVVGLPRIS